MEIRLKAITEENYLEAFHLQLKEVPEYDIWHLMIDKAYQGKGYGKAALHLYQTLGFDFTGEKDDSEVEMFINL